MKVPIFGAVVHKGDAETFQRYLSEGVISRRDVEIALGPSQRGLEIEVQTVRVFCGVGTD